MKSSILCSLLFVGVLSLPKVQKDIPFKKLYVKPLVDQIPKDIIPRITNGREAVPHSIPYQTYLIIDLGNGWGWACGGSLISPRHVLTAAHCLVGGVEARVLLGVHNVDRPENTQVLVRSRNLRVHEDYDDDRISDDIGIIVLNEPIELNKNINIVALPSREAIRDYEGDNARVSGWGLVSGDGDSSTVLLEVNTTVISNAQCGQVYDNVIDSQVCTAGGSGEGTCEGDSGGPLVVEDKLIGVVSYGVEGCLPGFPSGYTRVSSYLDWIEEITDLKF